MQLLCLNRVILITTVMAWAATSNAAEFDHMVFAADTTLHWPSSLGADATTSATLPLGQLRPLVHEASVIYGVGSDRLKGDVTMRLGYRFARGDFPSGNKIGNADATRYALSGIPLFAGFTMAFTTTLVRPVFTIEGGATLCNVTYDRRDEASATSGWGFAWGVRGGVGAQAAVLDWLAVRLLVVGEYSREVLLDRGPSLSMSHVGLALGVVTRTALGGHKDEASEDKEAIRSYTPLSTGGRSADAFAAIRSGDEAVKRRDFVAAEAAYRRGVELLSRDSETRLNVELPVRLDWARALIEIGRSNEAVPVVEEALGIDPQNRGAQAVVEELRRRGLTVTPPTARGQVEPLY